MLCTAFIFGFSSFVFGILQPTSNAQHYKQLFSIFVLVLVGVWGLGFGPSLSSSCSRVLFGHFNLFSSSAAFLIMSHHSLAVSGRTSVRHLANNNTELRRLLLVRRPKTSSCQKVKFESRAVTRHAESSRRLTCQSFVKIMKFCEYIDNSKYRAACVGWS